MKTAIFFLAALLLLGCVKNDTPIGSPEGTPSPLTDFCAKENSPAKMNLQEALDIFGQSGCASLGNPSAQQAPFCNAYTGTWWINLDPKEPKPGCNPACVVNVETGEAKINWRCTGLIVP